MWINLLCLRVSVLGGQNRLQTYNIYRVKTTAIHMIIYCIAKCSKKFKILSLFCTQQV